MAAGKHRSRFRCLTLARIVAASVVALAFAATVVVVVLTAGFGPDNVRLSVTHGHIQSAGLLWSRQDLSIQHLRIYRTETMIVYTPAEELIVQVSMDAHDPTRRATNVCVDAVHVLDMPHAPSFDGMVNITTVHNTVATGNAQKPCAPWRNNGSPSMRLDRWVTVHDPLSLMRCYISQKYGGINDFTVMLKVDIRILYPKGADYTDTHYCWPVTIGNTRSTRSEAVTCKPSNGIDYASNAPVLSACDHLTQLQRYICTKWGKLNITCVL